METNRQHKLLLISNDTASTNQLVQVLNKSGDYAVRTAATGQAAIDIHKRTAIDLALCDAELKGNWSSVETIRQLRLLNPLSIIYLTESQPTISVAQNKPVGPVTYLSKSASFEELFATIDALIDEIQEEPVVRRLNKKQVESTLDEEAGLKKDNARRETIFMIDDSIFIKCNYQFVKVPLKDIVLVEANNMYVSLITTTRKFVLRLTLSALLERLCLENLVRVHRSFAINIHKVELFTEHEVFVGQHRVPLGRHFRQQFIDQFQSR